MHIYSFICILAKPYYNASAMWASWEKKLFVYLVHWCIPSTRTMPSPLEAHYILIKWMDGCSELLTLQFFQSFISNWKIKLEIHYRSAMLYLVIYIKGCNLTRPSDKSLIFLVVMFRPDTFLYGNSTSLLTEMLVCYSWYRSWKHLACTLKNKSKKNRLDVAKVTVL